MNVEETTAEVKAVVCPVCKRAGELELSHGKLSNGGTLRLGMACPLCLSKAKAAERKAAASA